jgi:hypothetical protein
METLDFVNRRKFLVKVIFCEVNWAIFKSGDIFRIPYERCWFELFCAKANFRFSSFIRRSTAILRSDH